MNVTVVIAVLTVNSDDFFFNLIMAFDFDQHDNMVIVIVMVLTVTPSQQYLSQAFPQQCSSP